MLILTHISTLFSKYLYQFYINYIILYIVVYLINNLNGQLVIKPSEPILLRDQFKSFVASCTGLPNTRVGLCYDLLSIESRMIVFIC